MIDGAASFVRITPLATYVGIILVSHQTAYDDVFEGGTEVIESHPAMTLGRNQH